MNILRDPDAVIGAWLEDGPLTLPAETRQAISVGIRTVTRRRAGIAWPFAGHGLRTIEPRRLSFALSSAAVVVVAAALVLNFYANRQGIGGDPSPTPSASPMPTVPPFGLARNGAIALAKDGDILVADRPGGDLRPLVAGPEDDRSPMFSPDGTRLAFIRDTGQGSFLMVADADGTNVVAIPLEPTDLEYWSFAPDGRSLMAVGRIDYEHYRVFIRPVDPGAAPTVVDVQLLDAAMHRHWAIPTFNPMNAQEILVVAQLEPGGPLGGGLYVYDLATGGIRTIVEPADDQYFQDIAWLPDGEHIIYDSRIVAADGSGDQALDALRGRFSPLSNDGTRVVVERGGEGVQAPQPPVVVPINGDGEPVVIACGPATDIECPSPPTDWIWSPDDSMLIATVYHESSSGGLTETYLLVDARTGEVTKLDWVDVGTPAWQRVAP